MQTYMRIRYPRLRDTRKLLAGHYQFCGLHQKTFQVLPGKKIKRGNNTNEKLRGEKLHGVREDSVLIFFMETPHNKNPQIT